MSVYDHRDRSAHLSSVEPHYSKNRLVLRWWTPSHDELLSKQIEAEQWVWYVRIVDEILAVTPSEVIEAWKTEDPLCSKYAWYNVLMFFAISRADQLGLTQAIRKREWKVCPLCNHSFVDVSLPYSLVKRLGIDQLDFCAPCLSSTLSEAGNDGLSTQEVLAYLRDLTNVLERVPSQTFGEQFSALEGIPPQERLAVLRVLTRKPTVRRVKELFGSWFEALIEAGVLEDDARRMSRGTQCLARDGHVCFSLGEKTIDDTLHALGIPHEKEVSYPEADYRVDFAVGDVFIEYFGLTGDADYDAKTQVKQSICMRHGIRLISVYPTDLASSKKLESKLTKAALLWRPAWGMVGR